MGCEACGVIYSASNKIREGRLYMVGPAGSRTKSEQSHLDGGKRGLGICTVKYIVKSVLRGTIPVPRFPPFSRSEW